VADLPPLASGAAGAYFDEVYRQKPDPWNCAVDRYEQERYATQLSWLGEGGRRFARGLEVGCSEGLFTRMFATICDEVWGVDISAVAIGRAQSNLADMPAVTVTVSEFPDSDSLAPELFDAVTIAEVLYYFDIHKLASAVRWMDRALESGARIVITDFAFPDAVGHGGEIVHDVLARELKGYHLRADRPVDSVDGRAYRIDLFGRA
jgi:SAM-dependent methyltransferase